MKNSVIAFAGGIVAGTAGGFVGLGGAFVSIPLLVDVIGLSQHVAHGTSMASVLCTALGGSYAYWKSHSDNEKNDGNNIDIPVGLLVAASASGFAVLGAKLSKTLSTKMLKLSWGCMAITMAPLVVYRDRLTMFRAKKQEDESNSPNQLTVSSMLRPIIIGVAAGTSKFFFK